MHYSDEINIHGVPLKPPSSTSTPWKYDVFLSYRPKDTLKNFTGHLYTALDRAGIRTFMVYHNDDLPIGSDVSLESIKAIGESRASIIVFSKNYGSSSRCLDELVRIIDCKRRVGQLVLAIYYDVSPIDVREGFGGAFDARNFSEWDLNVISNGHEAKFIQKIVGHVRHKVRRIKLHVAKHPVGLDSRVEYLNSLLRIGSGDVRMVGIYGMGGIGKTTIVKALYNTAFYLFEGSCFLANVREEAERPNGIARLQGQLLCQLLGENNLKVANEHIGISILEERFRGKRVLIVLDDLDQLNQLQSLAGQSHWFGSGSRIIITTRNEHLLIQARTDDRYEANRLNKIESLSLFSWHAFQRTIPLKNYMHLSDGIVSYAAGVPLALEVLGASLMGRTMAQWKITLEKLQLIPDKKIQGILRISFDALDDDIKIMFLDIACFFNGMYRYSVIDVFKACGFFPDVGIRILIDRCLLRYSEGTIRMHDLLQDMGRHVVRSKFPNEPGKHSRLWLHKDVYEVLTEHKGTNEIEGIILDPPMQMLISTLAFAKMHKLRLLQIENAQLSGSFKGLFKELRWLSWHHSSLESLPIDFHPEKLTFLDMQNNNMNVVWHGIKFLTHLKILDLSQSKVMTATPDFSGTPNLEKLKLFKCTNLLKVHPSIGCLGRLSELRMEGCSNLQSLPSSICNAVSLEKLMLSDCKSFEQLPEDLGSLICLRVLQVDHTAIKTLPDSIGLLCNLNELHLNFCPRLVTLPSNICKLKSLQTLFVTACLNLEQFPLELGNMECLRELHVGGTAIKHLPDSIGLLKNLTIISGHGNCRSLATKSHFPSFQFLALSRSLNATTSFLPPSVSGLHSLLELDLSYCSLSDGDIPDDLGGLSSLRVLDLRKNRFCVLPSSLGQLTSLKKLFLSRCWKLKSILEFPPNLRLLIARDCIALENIPDLSNMKFLKSLDLESCCKLVNIFGLENLNCVQEINMEGCHYLSTSFACSLFQGYSGRFLNCNLHLPRREIPVWFHHQRLGSSISFIVENDSVELTLWVDYVQEGKEMKWSGPVMEYISAVLNNQTNGIKWCHYGYPCRAFEPEAKTWVNYGPQPYPLKTGDLIEVSFETRGNLKVEKCGIHLAYKSIIKATERSSLVTTEIDGDISALAISCNENKVSKRWKPIPD